MVRCAVPAALAAGAALLPGPPARADSQICVGLVVTVADRQPVVLGPVCPVSVTTRCDVTTFDQAPLVVTTVTVCAPTSRQPQSTTPEEQTGP